MPKSFIHKEKYFITGRDAISTAEIQSGRLKARNFGFLFYSINDLLTRIDEEIRILMKGFIMSVSLEENVKYEEFFNEFLF